MAMCVCKYVFNKHVIGWWGGGGGSGADSVIQVSIIVGRPVLARVGGGGKD